LNLKTRLRTVTGVDPTQYKIAIIIEVFGTFWSKPTFARPFTSVRPAGPMLGNFSENFITGGQDVCAERIFLFLVPIDAEIPLVGNGGGIPPELRRIAVATSVANRIGENETFLWSGHEWITKDTGECIWGPGPNYFSKDSAWVDPQGILDLSIRFVNGHWRCGEIFLTRSLGYGTYTFYLASDVSGLPDKIVFSGFIYNDSTGEEADVEFSNGDVVRPQWPWQYVKQP
jgi:hypothetical protein